MPNAHDVEQGTALQMIANYKKAHGEVVGFKYDKAKIMAILNQPNCTHLRIYYGYKVESGAVIKDSQIIVGVDSANKDLGTNDLTLMAEYGMEGIDQNSTLIP